MNPDCPHHTDAAAWLADELSPRERADFAQHLTTCASCRDAVEDARSVIGLLRSVPQVEAARDLAPLVLARIREHPEKLPRVRSWPRVAAIAALVTLFTGIAAHWLRGPAAHPTISPTIADASVARALDWFCKHQGQDGSWDARKWGGNPRYAVALTALPLIALLDNDATPERAAATERAIVFVQQQQNADGTFGEPFREAPFIQSVCTLALLRAYQHKPEPALRRSLDAALRVVFASQSSEGGWGYLDWPTPNLPVTLWHKDVVELAASLGWEDARPCLARATTWLAAQPAPAPAAAPATDNAATDYHQAYFAVTSLRKNHSPEARAQLAAIRDSLVSNQVDAGAESGTWQPTDQWSRVGGRIYSTALASLALR